MTEDFFERLAAPFPADAVSWRVGSTNQDKSKGLALPYLDARNIMDRLDLVCGPSRWQCRYTSASNPAVCEIGIYLPLCQGVDEDHGAACWEWVWKADGAGASDVEAEKGALSDALKRSAVRWGIGRYLYALPSPWVALEPAGRSWKIKESEHGRLTKLLERHARDWGRPPPPKVTNPETGRKVDPASPNQARKDGRGERFDLLQHEITDLTAVTECIAWGMAHKEEIETMPPDWQDDLRRAMSEHLGSLRAMAAREAGADEDGVVDDFPGDREAA